MPFTLLFGSYSMNMGMALGPSNSVRGTLGNRDEARIVPQKHESCQVHICTISRSGAPLLCSHLLLRQLCTWHDSRAKRRSQAPARRSTNVNGGDALSKHVMLWCVLPSCIYCNINELHS